MAELLANIISGVIYAKFGPRLGFTSMYLLSIVGSLFLVKYWTKTDLIPLFITLSKFGVSASFNMCFLAFIKLIPTMFCTSVFGLCNVLARITTMLAPLIAEQDYPTPLVANILSLAVAVGAS